jgi:hypothetical protein
LRSASSADNPLPVALPALRGNALPATLGRAGSKGIGIAGARRTSLGWRLKHFDGCKRLTTQEDTVMRRLTVMAALVLCLNGSASRAAMYVIENPGSKISNPADKMYNPAAQSNNPASNIYNPGARMDNANPLSPPTQTVTAPADAAQGTASAATPGKQTGEEKKYRPAIPQKKYYYKTVEAYVRAAKSSFSKDDFVEFLSITEDALRRIDSGTLQASANIRHKLQNYKAFGYGLLE